MIPGEKKYIVVVPCHFRSGGELCETTVARLKAVREIAKPGDIIIMTGDVPYSPGGPTLGELEHDWLVEHGIPESSILFSRGGVGAFSEARGTCGMLKGVTDALVLVSSGWYFFQGKPIWRRRAQENGLSVSFVSVRRTGGWRTKLLYAAYGLVVRLAICFDFDRALETRLTASQEDRRKGFTFDGCK